MASNSQPSQVNLARSSAIMAAGTLASRILGLLRNSLTGAVVGATILAADAWNAANTLPNIFNMLLAGGVLNAVIVPQIVKALRHADGGQAYVNRLLTISMAIMGGATVLATISSPLLIRLFTDEGWGDPERGLATAFAFLCMPQIFFYGLHILLGQILNAKGKFAAYMWSPALANVISIAGLLWFVLTDQPLQAPVEDWTPLMITVLAGSATLSIVAQAVVLIPPLRSAGFRFTPIWSLRGSGLGAATRMASWAFAAVLVSQSGFIITSRVLTGATKRASEAGLDAAGLFGYQNAFLLFMLPHSLVTVSLVTALFTRLSHAAVDRDREAVVADLHRGMRLPAVILIPATFAMVLLAPLILQALLFGNSREQTDTMVGVLVAMVIGLVPYGWLYLVQRVYYAFEDGATPFFLQSTVTVIATGFNLLGAFRPPTETAMWVGVGQTASNVVAALLGLWLLQAKLGPLRLGSVVRQNIRLIVAAAGATLVGAVVMGVLIAFFGDELVAGTLIGGFVGVLILVLSLVGAARLRVSEVSETVNPLLARIPAGRRRAGR